MENKYTSDVTSVIVDDREFILVGTAHISRQSADLVREVIENEKPDCVSVELDPQRYKALSEKKKWESLDLRAVIKNKQLTTLLINILLASYQKKLGEKLGVTPGLELLEAANTAKEKNIPIELCDRDVRITLRRAWNSMSLWQKMKFLSFGLAGVFEDQEISEEKLNEIKQKDALNELMRELGEAMPPLKTVLIDERDNYLATKIQDSPGKKIVAVVGAGHLEGIKKALEEKRKSDLKEIEIIPPVSPAWKWFGWGLPIVILLSIFYIGYTKGMAEAQYNMIFWFLANGIPSAFGAVIALAHPLVILTAFVAAPFTSLTPVIGAGYVAVFVQAYVVPPVVKEFQTVTDDIVKAGKWWSNKLLRLILVFVLTGLGSAVGTYVGAYEIISNLF
ncbi:MAG: TraB/GumN family protein [Melioribacteraceae bacterium]|nr:TraB/GumN family protein [Melioribacteraceae bacterium]MCF8354496.1 TraB/GumN family protein [Melioribacteraceae bacterium]MCF8394106.1 TraB/GumN family protein [Melioribacteraceae bacterium]MCF8419842.1 TraB/GumN family protein [Melioribacteraceae bacterium]